MTTLVYKTCQYFSWKICKANLWWTLLIEDLRTTDSETKSIEISRENLALVYLLLSFLWDLNDDYLLSHLLWFCAISGNKALDSNIFVSFKTYFLLLLKLVFQFITSIWSESSWNLLLEERGDTHSSNYSMRNYIRTLNLINRNFKAYFFTWKK